MYEYYSQPQGQGTEQPVLNFKLFHNLVDEPPILKVGLLWGPRKGAEPPIVVGISLHPIQSNHDNLG